MKTTAGLAMAVAVIGLAVSICAYAAGVAVVPEADRVSGERSLGKRLAELEESLQKVEARLGRSSLQPTQSRNIERRLLDVEKRVEAVERISKRIDDLERTQKRLETQMRALENKQRRSGSH